MTSFIYVMVRLDRTIGVPKLAFTGVTMPMVRSSRTMTANGGIELAFRAILAPMAITPSAAWARTCGSSHFARRLPQFVILRPIRHPPAWPYKIHTFPQARQPLSMVFNRKKPLRITTGPGCP